MSPFPPAAPAPGPAEALSERIRDLKFVVVGLGSAGRRHASNLAALGARRIEAVSAHRRLPPEAAPAGIGAVHHDLDAALQSPADVVVVANPTSLHADCAAKALRSGAHVYLEKPAASSAPEARALLLAAADARRVVAIGCQLRFDPCLTALRELILSGRLGRILSAQVMMGEYLPDYHPGENAKEGYAARRELGGGVLLTQIHDFDYLHWLLGPFDRAFAAGGRRSDVAVDVEDSVDFLLRSPSGFAAAGHMDFLQRAKTRRLTVAGDAASAVWDASRGTLLLSTAGKETDLGPGGPPDRNGLSRSCMADFLTAALDGLAPRTTLEDGVAALALVDAVKESMSTGAAAEVARP